MMVQLLFYDKELFFAMRSKVDTLIIASGFGGVTIR
jgi:hypothetical protein